jgi:hypothetical protein
MFDIIANEEVVQMNERLREAMAVARSGETREAQLIVAAILENSPDDAQAWYLMSHLVESPARRAVYLYKAVSLDPSNERAKAELARFPPAVNYRLSNSENIPAPTSPDLAFADGSSDLLNDPYIEEKVTSDELEAEALPSLAGLADEIPEPQPDVVATTGVFTDPRPAGQLILDDSAAKPQHAKRRQRQDGLLIAILVLLVIATVVVLGVLGYLLLLQG